MRKIKWILGLVSCVYAGMAMAITLSAPYTAGGNIPVVYTCDGKDVSPQLTWTAVPAGTQSFALILEDPDAPSGIWVHWVLYNIPGNLQQLAENSVPKTAISGKNSWQTIGYKGPCPPQGVHRYLFNLYALDTILTLQSGATATEVRNAAKSHVLGQATFMGKYQRSK